MSTFRVNRFATYASNQHFPSSLVFKNALPSRSCEHLYITCIRHPVLQITVVAIAHQTPSVDLSARTMALERIISSGAERSNFPSARLKTRNSYYIIDPPALANITQSYIYHARANRKHQKT